MIYNSFCIVGMIRLELTTTRPPDVYANQLRYIPNVYVLPHSSNYAAEKRVQR